MRTEEQVLIAMFEALIPWYEAHKRELPWRQDREPYHVWLSEIMLQQTRVEAVKEYYRRFLTTLPTIADLAEAPEEQILKLWEGLGYYNRVRNLLKAAQTICADYAGVFPSEYAQIRSLSGIGDYTAGAIASICFDAPTPAVDGNVLRVYSRLLADDANIDLQTTKKRITRKLQETYPQKNPGIATQALMELGATVCVPMVHRGAMYVRWRRSVRHESRTHGEICPSAVRRRNERLWIRQYLSCLRKIPWHCISAAQADFWQACGNSRMWMQSLTSRRR